MRMKLAAASLLAIGMATSAFAQSNPAPAGATMDRSTTDTGGGANGDVQKPMSTDTTTTGSTNSNMGSTTGNCAGGNQAANSSGTKGNSLQTQGGLSDATPTGENCSSQNN